MRTGGINMTPYRIAVVDDLERDRAWLAEKLAEKPKQVLFSL